MSLLTDLRKKIEEKKGKDKGFRKLDEKELNEAVIDIDAVENIVKKMKDKYKEQGIEFEEPQGKLAALRGVITDTSGPQVNTQMVEELTEFKSPLVSSLGKLFLRFELVLKPILKAVKKFPVSKELAYHLYSANMAYSVQQYLALTVAAASIVFFIALVLSILGSVILKFSVLLALLLAIGVFLFTLVIILLIPKSIGQRRGDDTSSELPFALRHMSSSLRAGIGLHKTLQTIAAADYGVLSQEFSRTLNEIEEGTDTQVALRHFALRTQSRALRSALLHIIRALKTGGSLSDIMNDIAEDVSFELRLKISDFAEKMNFFGVIFIFGAIVLPVFLAIIGAVANAPLGKASLTGTLNLQPQMILIIYTVLMPLVLAFLVFYVKMTQPRV